MSSSASFGLTAMEQMAPRWSLWLLMHICRSTSRVGCYAKKACLQHTLYALTDASGKSGKTKPQVHQGPDARRALSEAHLYMPMALRIWWAVCMRKY